jgi:hypothetical protein
MELSSLDEQVNQKLQPQAPTPTATTEATLPESKAPQVEQQLREEIAALKREQAAAKAESEASLTAERLKVACEQAHSKPNEKVDNGRADAELNRAIAGCKGLAFWTILTESEKTAALGIQGVERVKDSDLRKIFGNSSDGMAANRLAKSSPEEYRRLRLLSKIRGIL